MIKRKDGRTFRGTCGDLTPNLTYTYTVEELIDGLWYRTGRFFMCSSNGILSEADILFQWFIIKPIERPASLNFAYKKTKVTQGKAWYD